MIVKILGANSEIDQINVRAALILKVLAPQHDIVRLNIIVGEAQIMNGL